VEYLELRQKLIEDLIYLQRNKVSYQSICDFINNKQDDFTLFKDFFTRFRSKDAYYKGKSKTDKLKRIYQYTKAFREISESKEERLDTRLIRLVKEANAEEFYAYTQVNKKVGYNEDRLKAFFGVNNPAAIVIRNTLRHKKQYNWILNRKDYGCDFRILAIDVTSKFSEYATIQTNEYWKLSWVDKKTKTLQFVYDSINEQTYLVAKNKDGSWYIKDNIYSSDHDKRRPRYIDDDTLAEMIANGERANYRSLKKLLETNELGLALAFVKRLTQHKIKRQQNKMLKQISFEYLENLRQLNINNRSAKKFKNINRSLNKEILSLWKSIFKK